MPNLLDWPAANKIADIIFYKFQSLIGKLLKEELPVEQRKILEMRYYSKMSFKEISENCNISINTALGRMRYAIINLRKIIQKKGVSIN